jgi:hypothetical protein
MLMNLEIFKVSPTQSVDNYGYEISAGVNGGPRSWVCALATLRLTPHQHQKKFGPHVAAKSPSNISPKPLKGPTQSFRTLGQLLKIPPFVWPNIA